MTDVYFWSIFTDTTRVRARKKHSPTGLTRLRGISFDAELDALSMLKICRVLVLEEKFHREKMGRNDVENRRFSAFFDISTLNSTTGGHFGGAGVWATPARGVWLSNGTKMGSWTGHST
jgi:hypothetical protein